MAVTVVRAVMRVPVVPVVRVPTGPMPAPRVLPVRPAVQVVRAVTRAPRAWAVMQVWR
jgi:hypothetical protein